MFKLLRIFTIGIVLTVIAVCSASAQLKPDLKGTITDSETGEPLPGANVFLKGTGFGASSDIEGRYFLSNVTEGAYVLRISYLGYKTQEMNVVIHREEGRIINFKLRPEALEGKDVVITAQAEGQLGAVNRKLSSLVVVDAVSKDRIQELHDANAAESVGRLPGMSVLRSGGEGQQVVVRGIQPKYNNITIDGIKMASTNADDRSVDLSVISSEMLEGIEVTKTVTADQVADVIGGTVNFRMREAKETEEGNPIFGLTMQGARNGLTNAYNKLNNYKLVGSLEDRFFEGSLGVFAQAGLERTNLTSNELSASYGQFGNDPSGSDYVISAVTLSFVPRDRRRANGTLVLDYKLSDEGKIVFSNFLSQGITTTNNGSEVYNVSAAANSRNFNFNYAKSTTNIITNSLHYDQKFSLVHSSIKASHTYSETKDPHDWVFSFLQNSANLAQFANQKNIDPKIIPGAAPNDISHTILTTINSNSNFSRERALTGSVDLDMPLNVSDLITTTLKFGGKIRYQTRSNTAEQYTGQGFDKASAKFAAKAIADIIPEAALYGTAIPMSLFVDPNFHYGTFLNGDYEMYYPLNQSKMEMVANHLHDNAKMISDSGGQIGYGYNMSVSKMQYYSGTEQVNAFYLMDVMKIGSALTIIPGIRYQELRSKYTGYQGIDPQIFYDSYSKIYDTTVTHVYPYWLPDISVRWQPFDWLDARVSYSNTISYQDYSGIYPRIQVTLSNAILYNNDNLKPSRAKNYDAYLSFHDNYIGLFSVGGFVKYIDDIIYSWTFNRSGLAVYDYYPQRYVGNSTTLTAAITTQINNPNRSEVYGYELDWQTRFWYLPSPFDNVVLNVNYTHSKSSSVYPITWILGSGRNKRIVDTTLTYRLIAQPNELFNLSLGYDLMGFSIRVSFQYTADIFGGPNQWPQLVATTSPYRRWDISLKQDLPLPGLQLYSNLVNLNGAYDRTTIAASNQIPRTMQQYGFVGELGLRWTLN
ncbi:MAG: TonB-dependent receptor [Bacteroidetes bacterium]|nr:TonB-dependent receptor [Bacteroidota bacterium]